MQRADFGRLIRARDFRLLVGVRIAGSTADGLLQAALTSFVLFSPERQPTPMKILTAFGVLLLPYSFLGPFVGVVIDRWRRQRILVIATLLRAVCVLVVAATVATGNDGRRLALVVLIALGVARFVLATLSAALPHVVDEDLLVAANAVAPTSGTLMSIVGGLVGLGIATTLGGGDHTSVLLICTAAALHVTSSLIAARIPVDLLGPERPSKRTLWDVLAWLLSGLRHLRAHPRATRAIATVSMHRMAFGGATLLTLILMRNAFNPADQANAALQQFSFAIGCAGGGAFIGALLTPPMSERIGVVRWARSVLFGASLVIGVGYLYGVLRAPEHGAYVMVLLGATAIGFAGQCVKIASDSVVQTTIDDAYRGRVFALYDMSLNVGIIIGTALAAYVLPTDGRSWIYAVLLAATVGIASTIRN